VQDDRQRLEKQLLFFQMSCQCAMGVEKGNRSEEQELLREGIERNGQ
jgi:hypothetical protein